MNITVGHTTFDRVRDDSDANTLYLHAGEPDDAADFDESLDGHALRFNADGEWIGVTIVNAKRLLDGGKPIVITVPDRIIIDLAALAPVVS